MTNISQITRPIPRLLILALVLKGAWLGWLLCTTSVPSTSDSACFKQPAYMRLYTPYFSIPSYEGRCPDYEIINSYPAVLYFYLNYVTFSIFGFSYYSSSGIDLLLHFLFTGLGAWSLWRLTESQLPAILFVAVSGAWLLPSGRPEELGMLFVLISILTVERGKWGFAASLIGLGLAGVTSPGSAIVGTALVVTYLGFREEFSRRFWPRAALIFTLPILLSAVLYVGYAWPYTAAAIQQDHLLRSENVYATVPFSEIVASPPTWMLVLLIQLMPAIFVAALGNLRHPRWFPRGTSAAAWVSAAAVAILVGMTLNLAAGRLLYDYRHVTVLSLTILAIATSWMTTRTARYGVVSWTVACFILLVSLPSHINLVRHSLSPLACGADAVSFAEAKATVDAVIPPDASVGGDGAVWELIDDGRPFLLTRTIGLEHWPDYVISGNWSTIPPVLGMDEGIEILGKGYDEITPHPRPADGCGVRLPGFRIPVASGRCDWHVRIWKRRDRSKSVKDF